DQDVFCASATDRNAVSGEVLPTERQSNPSDVFERLRKRLGVLLPHHIGPLVGCKRHADRQCLIILRTEVVHACLSPPATVWITEVVVLLLKEQPECCWQMVGRIDHYVLCRIV